jgi:hypothetical protein
VNLTYSSVIVTNGLTHIYSGISGTQIQGEIILLNNSDEEQTVSFSLHDIFLHRKPNFLNYTIPLKIFLNGLMAV